ncbi:hypothetical protein P4O66_004522 [Electrophorus voltai]|uniref:Reverse transcriptase domain-containing protein n=1 Tax=Electrophorus voltai TaxID=2609070 RepID=A0AAD9E421_9TELE|nr:hypothetical protein P4O66_004522 [Electrophorus voltai]
MGVRPTPPGARYVTGLPMSGNEPEAVETAEERSKERGRARGRKDGEMGGAYPPVGTKPWRERRTLGGWERVLKMFWTRRRAGIKTMETEGSHSLLFTPTAKRKDKKTSAERKDFTRKVHVKCLARRFRTVTDLVSEPTLVILSGKSTDKFPTSRKQRRGAGLGVGGGDDITYMVRSQTYMNLLLQFHKPSTGSAVTAVTVWLGAGGAPCKNQLVERSPGARVLSERPAGARALSERPAGARALSERPAGARALSERSAGARALSERSAGARVLSERSAGARALSERPPGARALSERNTASDHGLGCPLQGPCPTEGRNSLPGKRDWMRTAGAMIATFGAIVFGVMSLPVHTFGCHGDGPPRRFRPIVRRSKPLLKQVRTWPAGAISALQDCFEQTTWITLKEAASDGGTVNLEEYTASVTGYISKDIDDVTVSKTITTRPNQKPWMPAEVRMLLKTRDSAFRTGDREALRKTRAKLSRAIREAKRAHAQRIHGHFKDTGDTRRMWEGVRAITNYRKTPPSCDSDATPDALNDFYARFEAQNNVAAEKSIAPQNDQVLCLTAADVRRTLRGVNPRKAAGPDNIPGHVLRECAVLTDIFNISLSCAVVPTCFKTTTIIPVPKKPTVSCLNDYRPIALTSIIMKCFERLVMRHIKTQLPPSLDPLQFAYRCNCSTDDAISTTLHLALTHLDKKGTYIRMLFIDFSSAFNTIVPQHLIGKLSLLGLNTSLCNWILDFLTGRPQSVWIGSSTSNTTTLSAGAPQGSVLSPLLFTLLTHDCAAMQSSNHIIKIADDTTVVGLINKDNESAYREEVRELVSWCKV